jgi:glutathione S-transferase
VFQWIVPGKQRKIRQETEVMKLYFAPKTRAVRVAWLLEELNLPYRLERLKLGDPAMRSDSYRAVHPMGRVPVLEDGNVRIFESGAIVQYILARYGEGRFNPDVQSPDFPDYLQWLHYAEGMIMPPINALTVETILLPPERRTEINVTRATKLLGQMLQPVNVRLEGRDYLAGAFSAADIMTGSGVISAQGIGIDFSNMPNLSAYADRLRSRPAYQKAASL